ncbi:MULTISPECIES: CidA/LrgA family protein [unclassified Apibacter]|uniref:CidA/LrgA family protein n=1 Tax=unclassified Apibacter TaxID=2630820 RepID=UPI001320B2A4|nr:MULTISPECIES: CidA/LrgA family protein [unclassified Apibacter]MCX8677733.1 CidA/LrgA family protein [Apibacter sp. B3919]MXO25009.1 CidA/LrgA family protein [Apibacter sp. B3924]MXO27240.1 CidA/LrgA family protein [Apibacter sp. B3813]MXO29053.1 CidA/LrgA family protein [Apibacter sp. B3913]MXO31166.1 CidA/LrgA family protein [Apibacter sp. B3912]
MKLISQLGIILLLYFIGELIVFILQIKIPGSILGMLLLLVSLQLNIIKVEDIKEVATFFLNNMLILFIPLGVGLASQWDLISKEWLAIIISIILSTFIVLLTVSLLIRKKKE